MTKGRLYLTQTQKEALETAAGHFTDDFQPDPRGLPRPISIHPPPDSREKLKAAILYDAKFLGKAIPNLASRNAIKNKLEQINVWANKAQSTWAGITPDMLMLLSGAGGSPVADVKHLVHLGFILQRISELCQLSLDNLPQGTGRRTASVPISTSGHPSYRDPITHVCERWWFVWNHWVDVPEVTNPNNQGLRARRASGFEAFLVNLLQLAQSFGKQALPKSLNSVRKRAWPVHARLLAMHSEAESGKNSESSLINFTITGLMPCDAMALKLFLRSRGIHPENGELGCS